MTTRTLVPWCAVAFAHVVAASSAHAQCGSGYIGLAQMLSRDSAAIVFVGTATIVERAGSTETVAFDVERAWKGPVTERTMIYRPIPVRIGSAEFSPAVFERGKPYVVIAHRLSAAERTDLGLADREDTFGTDMCGDGSRPFLAASEEDFRMIGPGRPPADQPSRVRRPTITPPRKTRNAAPIYPDGALKAGVRGVVIVEMTVDETGRVSRASILRSIPFLDQAAIDCVMKWEYLPTLIDGVPQPVTMTATVSFAP